MAAEFTELDRTAMARALELAARGLETTDPNPRVGCVIVRDGRIVAEGWHERAGGPHAEIVALQAAGGASEGATVYVTLEPCNHHGRTPPCVDALIAARVARVVYALRDPFPLVDGRGAERLREAGITVESGLLEGEAAELNAGFLKRVGQGRPYVRVKLAASLDGRTALANGASRWITGEEARADVQRWRARSSAVLTGIGTVLADDPRLDVRLPGERRQPLRVVLDGELRTPPGGRLLAPGGGRVLIFGAESGRTADRAARRERLEARGAIVEAVPALAGRLDLAAVLARLAALEVNEVLVEAGPTLSGAFLAGGFADELLIYLAPLLLGPQARPLAELPQIATLAESRRLEIVEAVPVGADLRVRLRPR